MKNLLLACLLYGIASTAIAQTSVMDFYNAKVKTLSEFAGKPMNLPIKKKDVANGFIAYYTSDSKESWEEMAYYTAKNGKKFVVVTTFSCPENLCGNYIMPQFYELQNGMLFEKTYEYLSLETGMQVQEYVKDKDGKLAFVLGTAVKRTMWIKVPQQGTTIQIGLQEFGDPQFKFHLACELAYNEATGTFTLVKKF